MTSATSFTGFRHILVPIDFAASSDRAVEMAIGIAEASDALLTLAYVYPIASYLYAAAPFMPMADMSTALEGSAKAAVAKRLAEVRARHAKTDAIVRQGYPSDEILTMIAEQKPDLVIVGTHGRHGLPRAILGSVAERVVRMSPVPVMTVRAEPAV